MMLSATSQVHDRVFLAAAVRLALTLCTLATGCRDTTDPPVLLLPDSTSRLEQWAGGTLRIAPLRGPGADTAIFAGVTRLETISRDSGSTTVRLPRTMSGELEIRLGSPAGRLLGRVHVAGFVEEGNVPLQFYSNTPILAWPSGGPASFLGTDQDLTLVRYQPGTGTVDKLLSPYDLSGTGEFFPGPTPYTGVLLLQPPSWQQRGLEMWQLLPTATRIRVFPFSVTRDVAQLNDSTFLLTGHHHTGTYRFRGLGLTALHEALLESPDGIYLSPRGDRATLTASASPDGVPVFGSTGDLVFFVKALKDCYGVAFSPAGDTLFVAGSLGPLIAIDATTGTELARRSLDMWVSGLRVWGPWLLVAGATPPDFSGSYLPRILVLDRQTFAIVGAMDVPTGHESAWQAWYSTAAATDGAFMLDPDHFYHFDLLTP